MSLILEALRKSEAERRRGRAPDLHAELPPVQARSRRMPPPWFWIAATAALLLAATIFWMREKDAPESNPRAGRPAASTVPDARTPADNREPVATSPPPYPRVDRITAPPAAPASAAPPGPEEADAGAATATATRTREAAATPTAPAAGVMPTEIPDSPPDAPASASAPVETRDAIVRLSELPPGERKQLPTMKLSMHMWNERPAQRFVIIDGQRYIEGDRIGAGVVRAIDSDGVILDLEGRQVRVPIR